MSSFSSTQTQPTDGLLKSPSFLCPLLTRAPRGGRGARSASARTMNLVMRFWSLLQKGPLFFVSDSPPRSQALRYWGLGGSLSDDIDSRRNELGHPTSNREKESQVFGLQTRRRSELSPQLTDPSGRHKGVTGPAPSVWGGEIKESGRGAQCFGTLFALRPHR